MSVRELAQQGRYGPIVIDRNILVRTGSAVVLLAIALAAAFLGGVPAGIVAAAFAVVVLLEWGNISGGTAARTAPYAAAIAIAVVAGGAGMVVAAIAIAALTAIVAAAVGREPWLPGGVVYAAALGIGLIAIRVAPEYGLAALLFVLAVVWATDSGAFFAGRTIGGVKLWPRISPKKTWAGAIGGLGAALAAGIAVAVLAGVPVSPGLIVVTIVLSAACQAGDLFESWVKRHFGVKDSGSIIPGHGGVMDRVDGLTFAAAAAAVIGAGHGGAGGLGRGLLIW